MVYLGQSRTLYTHIYSTLFPRKNIDHMKTQAQKTAGILYKENAAKVCDKNNVLLDITYDKTTQSYSCVKTSFKKTIVCLTVRKEKTISFFTIVKD